MDKTRKVGTIVLVSVLSGLILALLLSLMVFAGSIEPVITGAIMVGFAAGWLMLAVLSTRTTDQPQKWAYVPALYFGVVGLLLIVWRPSGNLIAASGWVWPLVLAGLTVWMYMQIRLELKSRSRRWVLYPVLVVLMLASIGGGFERIHETVVRNNYPVQGQLVDVGGYRLHIQCTGTGSPTVVLEAGLGEPSPIMSAWIAPAVAKQTRVCVYDREGRGWSEQSPHPLDGAQTAAALHTLLTKVNVRGPVVVAGHSAGGIYALNYAKEYPNQVKGVVLLDSMSPYQNEKLPGWSSFYGMFRRVSALVPTLTRLGVGPLAYTSAYAGLPSPQREQQRAFWASPELWRSQRDEFSVLKTALKQAQSLKSLDGKPLYVVSGEKGQQTGWAALQEQLATLSSNSVHLTVQGATHEDIPGNQEVAAKSAHAILQVVASVKSGEHLKQ
ncbi:MAG: alpha/beta hydrolase [Candidatus Saccharimonadales bacterium]